MPERSEPPLWESSDESLRPTPNHTALEVQRVDNQPSTLSVTATPAVPPRLTPGVKDGGTRDRAHRASSGRRTVGATHCRQDRRRAVPSMPRVLLQLLRPSRRPRLARILSSSQPEGHCTSVGDATMLGVSTYRPIGVLAMGLIWVLGCAFVLFFWVGPDGLPALLYAWRLAPSTTSEATVVNTEISRSGRLVRNPRTTKPKGHLRGMASLNILRTQAGAASHDPPCHGQDC